MALYAAAADLAARYDINIIGQLVTDDGQKLSRQAVLEHPNLAVALQDASGRVESALLHGGRYTTEHLQALTDNSLAYLKRITCAFAMSGLLMRRPGTASQLREAINAETEEYLKLLSSGMDVFNIDAHKAAGLLADEGNTNSESVFLLTTRNLLSDRLNLQLFPNRGPRANTYRRLW